MSKISKASSKTKNTPNSIEDTSTILSPQASNRQMIQKDLAIMMHFITKRGINLPTNIDLTNTAEDSDLIETYNTLVNTIKPATVQSIHYINTHMLNEEGEDRKWYSTPILAKCLIIAIIALVCMIGISLSPDVNAKNQTAGLLTSSGLVLFYNLIFICSASLLGVMFYLLKTLSDKIKNYTLLPIDAIDVNSAIIIGVISGFIISELFIFTAGSISSSIEMKKMTLALLGGFSSDAIFSVLKGIINKAKALFSTSS